jgi:hypothetical protein
MRKNLRLVLLKNIEQFYTKVYQRQNPNFYNQRFKLS